jgi:hypothetical protein
MKEGFLMTGCRIEVKSPVRHFDRLCVTGVGCLVPDLQRIAGTEDEK